MYVIPFRFGAMGAAALIVLALMLGGSWPGAARASDRPHALEAAVAASRAQAPAPRLARAAFIAAPSRSAVTLSPDGRDVAFLQEHRGERGVWLQPVQGGPARRLLPRTDAHGLHWSHDGRWLLLESSRRLVALGVGANTRSGLVSTLGGATRRMLHAVDPVHPAAVLLIEHERTSAGAATWRLVRVDMRGRREVLHRDRLPVTAGIIGPQGDLRFVQRVEGEALVIHRVAAHGRLQPVVRCGQLHRCVPLATTHDGDGLLLRSDLEGDLNRVMRLDARGGLHTLHADPRGTADLDGLVLDPRTREPVVATYTSAGATAYGLSAQARPLVDAITRALPGAALRIEIGHGPGAHWLVEQRADDRRELRWHVFDPATRALRLLFDDRRLDPAGERPAAALPAGALVRRVPVSWRASDGMRLHGFVLLPPGIDPARAPLVALVHGGPWNHVRAGYSPLAQLLANRGYAVFEPNFRGSTGHGRTYMLAAQGDFGHGRVQRDIVEGVRAMLAHGVGDPQRVGIAGASFGGYAALLGLTFEPGLFKVGVAVVPPPDFGWNGRWIARAPESLALSRQIPMLAWLRMVQVDVENPDTLARLHAQSPLANAARMRRPLLLIAGGEDKRVAISGVIEYAARLKRLDRDVSLLVDPRAGHSNDDPLAREARLYLAEAMLQRHLGGSAPVVPSAQLRSYLDRNLRLTGATLRDRPWQQRAATHRTGE